MDGSSFAFTLALQAVGRVELASRAADTVDRSTASRRRRPTMDHSRTTAKSHCLAAGLRHMPSQRLELEYRLDFGPSSPIRKSQSCHGA